MSGNLEINVKRDYSVLDRVVRFQISQSWEKDYWKVREKICKALNITAEDFTHFAPCGRGNSLFAIYFKDISKADSLKDTKIKVENEEILFMGHSSKVSQVKIYNMTPEIDSAPLISAFEGFGKILKQEYCTFGPGNRANNSFILKLSIILKVKEEELPAGVTLTDEHMFQTFHTIQVVGAALKCTKCFKMGHKAADCTKRSCRYCGEETDEHGYANCPLRKEHQEAKRVAEDKYGKLFSDALVEKAAPAKEAPMEQEVSIPTVFGIKSRARKPIQEETTESKVARTEDRVRDMVKNIGLKGQTVENLVNAVVKSASVNETIDSDNNSLVIDDIDSCDSVANNSVLGSLAVDQGSSESGRDGNITDSCNQSSLPASRAPGMHTADGSESPLHGCMVDPSRICSDSESEWYQS